MGLCVGLTSLALFAHAQQKNLPAPVPPVASTAPNSKAISSGTAPNSMPRGAVTANKSANTSAAKSEPVQLQMKFMPGDINKYQMSMQATILLPGQAAGTMNPYDTHINLIVQQRVAKVNADGSADIAISTLSGTGVVNGKPYAPPKKEKPSLLTFDARNNIVNAKNLPTNADVTMNIFQSGALSTQGVYLPGQPVKIGDSWSQKANIASLGQGSSGTVKTTFLKLEQVGLFNTARLRSIMKIPFKILNGSSKMKVTLNGMLTMTYDSNLAIKEGKVVRSTGNGDITVAVVLPDSSSSNTANTSGGKKPTSAKSEGTSAQSQKVTVKLQQGNNLITQ